jgi:hypothetical protein
VQVRVVATVMLPHRRKAQQHLLTVVQKLLTKDLLRLLLRLVECRCMRMMTLTVQMDTLTLAVMSRAHNCALNTCSPVP